MKSVGYHAFIDTRNSGLNSCSAASTEYPLLVNCAGIFANTRLFTSENPVGREDYYLMYIVSGRLEVGFPDGMRVCGQGSLIIFPPNKRYIYRHVEESLAEYFFVHFTGYEAEKILGECGIAIHPECNTVRHSDSTLPKFRSMFDAFAKHDNVRDREISAIFTTILVHLSRRIVNDDGDGRISLHTSIGKILSSYSERITVPMLAELENLSVSRYHTLFKKKMNKSPAEFIAETRMTAACELLTQTDMSIKEISTLCGYDDSHLFSRNFRKSMGIPPSEYRKGKRNN